MPSVFDPGLRATRDGLPPVEKVPTATVVVPSRLATGDDVVSR